MRKKEHFALPKNIPKTKKKFRIVNISSEQPSTPNENNPRHSKTTRTHYSDEKSIHKISSKQKPGSKEKSPRVCSVWVKKNPQTSCFDVEKQEKESWSAVDRIQTSKEKGQERYSFAFKEGKYEGQFARGMRQGFGILYFPNNDKYMGNFHWNKPDGHGTYYSSNGDKMMGIWYQGKLINKIIQIKSKQ